MVTFASHLQTWMNAQNISLTILASRAGLSQQTIKNLKLGRTSPSQKEVDLLAKAFRVPTATFLRGCDINVAPVATVTDSNTPSEAVVEEKDEKEFDLQTQSVDEILDRYTDSPVEYRRIISDLFITKIIKLLKVPKSQVESLIGASKSCLSLYTLRKTAITKETLFKYADSIERNDAMNRSTFLRKFCTIFIQHIPNWNLHIAANKYYFSQASLSKKLGLADATCALWNSYYAPLPQKYVSEIASYLHIDADLFLNKPLNSEDFTDEKIDLPYNAIAASQLKQYAKNVKTKKQLQETQEENTEIIKSNTETSAATEDVTPNESAKETPVNSEESVKESAPEKKQENSTLITIPMDMKIQKMYTKLSEEHRQAVNEIIERYFWEDL